MKSCSFSIFGSFAMLPTVSTLLVIVLICCQSNLLFAQDKSAKQDSTDKAAEKVDAQKEEWIQLFNGKNLDGWTPKFRGEKFGVNFKDTFQVEDGILKVGFDKYENFDRRFGHLFYKEKFSNYVIRVEYRFVGKQCPGGPGWANRNSGIMVHCQDPESMAKEQNFPVSIEVQLLGGNGKAKRTTLNLCTPGTNVVMNGKLFRPHCTSSTSETYLDDKWVTAEVEVRGGKTIKHIIDGKVVLEYSEPQLDDRDAEAKLLIKDGNLLLTEGFISLQSESHPCEFRKVELRKLK